ncbi:formate dehydrogenase subunit alpha [Macrococcoides caseolyticum subsp. caseolyticum]|uniref:formate dehydrogenase subunit alpha n=1 Tax=Macrococcoides caseolyticum TaxID=69966 RepID=UPI000C34E5E7|nr:formate dehydrogenase subunit alpha [Macrococcus caseolyticus]PKE20863.1 formate dehydrogenase subunit alpha [Macrococcus caseolyticus]PKE36755.1 formate dehydrogenase subunit alpha [Macrococcus caseolyticus]PKE71541.1 formate dehydrogenase subunit alpha [Macrococcus caseolyticus]PKE75730.1 formate dehydrogenase subunit alpha [Macrococcus caseolyticus]PKF05693.1 formate dehydrogenase subunit alpha [Macrococcus caseolyticus]
MNDVTSQSVSITLNGKPMEVPNNVSILDYLRFKGIDVPALCYHPDLGAIETCDACIVEVNGELVRSCSTQLKDGDIVKTGSSEAFEAQMIAMDRILRNHELYCTVCDFNNGNCTVHNTVKNLKIDHQATAQSPKGAPKNMGKFYRYDPDQCILCGRCVQACQNVQVNETLMIDWELERPRVIWDGNTDLNIDDSSCVNCGHCSTVCPCNAMMEVGMIGEAGFLTGMLKDAFRPAVEVTKAVETGYTPLMAISDVEAEMRKDRIKKTKTVCTYCGVGCSFEVWTKGREVLKVEPSPEAPANQISTCVKGKFGWDFVNSGERLTKPLIRETDGFREATWEEALNLISSKFKETIATRGPERLAFITSSKCTNEESYLMQKLARQVVGTNNVDNCSRYCQSPATMGLWRTVGYGGDSGSITDIARAELIIGLGTNTAEAHPVIATRVKSAQKLRGSKLLVVDIRKHELAERADMFVRPNPGSDLVWLNAVTKYIIDNNWQDQAFIDKHVNNYSALVEGLQKYTIDYAAEHTGMSKEEIIKIAEMIHEAKTTAVMWAMGVTQQRGGSDTSTAISNLLLVTGNYMKPGAGSYPLRGHNNVQGASDMGSMPTHLPGYQKIADKAVLEKFSKAWGVEMNPNVGQNNHQMVDAMHADELDVLYLKGEDMGIVDSNINYVREGFEKLKFFVVQDIFFSKTAEYADVILPAAPSFEKEGTFSNTERRIQRLYQVMEPLEGTKPDWKIIQEIAQHMGADWNYVHPGDIMDEIASLAPIYSGVSYDRLEGFNSLQWPVKEDGTDSPLLFTEGFPFEDKKANFFPVDWTEPTEYEAQYDIHVNNGRLLEHFHEGNMTYQVKGLAMETPDAFLEISQELADERGIQTGNLVRLQSPYGKVDVRALITDRVFGKEVYLPMNDNGDAAINLLSSSIADKDTSTPAYKETKAKLIILDKGNKSPLPENNFRFGNRVPQMGVNVEAKWRRDDYVYPGDIVKMRGDR